MRIPRVLSYILWKHRHHPHRKNNRHRHRHPPLLNCGGEIAPINHTLKKMNLKPHPLRPISDILFSLATVPGLPLVISRPIARLAARIYYSAEAVKRIEESHNRFFYARK